MKKLCMLCSGTADDLSDLSNIGGTSIACRNVAALLAMGTGCCYGDWATVATRDSRCCMRNIILKLVRLAVRNDAGMTGIRCGVWDSVARLAF